MCELMEKVQRMGIEQGRAEGRQENMIEVALRMKRNNFDSSAIECITGYDEAALRDIAAQRDLPLQ